MPRTIRIVTAAVALFAIAGAASAQSRASFQTIDAIDGVVVTPNTPLSFTVTAGAAPTLTLSSTVYTINSIFGFWVLSDDDNLTPGSANFNDLDGATWATNNNNGGAGGIAGWSTNPNTGITPSDEPVSFTFTSLSGTYERFGMHIRVNETLPGGGNTAFFVVPTPGTAALLAMGGLLSTRRRR